MKTRTTLRLVDPCLPEDANAKPSLIRLEWAETAGQQRRTVLSCLIDLDGSDYDIAHVLRRFADQIDGRDKQRLK